MRLLCKIISFALAALTVGGCAGAAESKFPTARNTFRATRSWMRAGTSQENLLYVGDGVGGVLVYEYKAPSFPIVGVLNEPSIPGGQCVDTAQNVFIPDSISDSRVIYEYAHGSTEPMQILGGMHDTPLACSSDPKTGNLAVLSE